MLISSVLLAASVSGIAFCKGYAISLNPERGFAVRDVAVKNSYATFRLVLAGFKFGKGGDYSGIGYDLDGIEVTRISATTFSSAPGVPLNVDWRVRVPKGRHSLAVKVLDSHGRPEYRQHLCVSMP